MAGKKLAVPKPSASVVLISPSNKVLLCQRVRTASAFAAAHVFPGGNLDPQDGQVADKGAERHADCLAYRKAALRELLEESGILLARSTKTGKLIHVDDAVLDRARKDIYSHQISFVDWLRSIDPDAQLDTDSLIPFTHWITPPPMPKRFTTQMYIYPIPHYKRQSDRRKVPVPTSDGGIEITSAEFKPAAEWLDLIHQHKVLAFPPQYYILSRLNEIVNTRPMQSRDDSVRRKALEDLAYTGSPSPSEMCIGTIHLDKEYQGKRILLLDHPGIELKGTTVQGDPDRVMLSIPADKVTRTVGIAPRELVMGSAMAAKL